MKRASKITLIVSSACFLTGVGGLAAPALRESISLIAAPSPKEEPAPTLTPLSRPDKDAPRFTVRFPDTDTAASVFQAIALNNNGELLCITEDREPMEETFEKRESLVRYRTTRTRYLLYRDGKIIPVLETGPIVTFRPLAFNDRSQVLGFSYDLEEIKKVNRSRETTRRSPAGFQGQGPSPMIRNTQLALWENGQMRSLPIAKALVAAGMPPRYQPFIESATINMNSRTQILVGLQSLFLWENGKAKKIGKGSISNGERIFINDRGTIVRRSDQYRSSPDGTTAYPLVAIYPSGKQEGSHRDFGYMSFVVDVNNRDELLVGRMFLPGQDSQRTQFTRWHGDRSEVLFTVNGRTPARLNSRGYVLAWRQIDTIADWRSIFSSTASVSRSIPVLWDGKKLYDLPSLLPVNYEITSLTDFNDRNQILVQARVNGKLRMLLLEPETAVR